MMSQPATPGQPSPAVVPSSPAADVATPEALSEDELQRRRLEDKLEQLLQSLLEVGICTSDVQESAREGMSASGGVPWGAGGLLGKKINESIIHMAELDDLNQSTSANIPIPMEVINLVDQGTNPDRWLKSFVERASHENMFTNGIVSNLEHYHTLLEEQLLQSFPDLKSAPAAPAHPAR